MASAVRHWMHSYGSDYLALILLESAYLLIVFFVEPFHRMFYINNLNILFPHALVERVPVAMNIFYAGFLPIMIIFSWLLTHKSSHHKLHVTALGFFISIVLTVFVTDTVKNAVGRPRPDLIARCKPAQETPENTLVTIAVCTETNHQLLHDGWRSFPSGHSSFAFSGLGYLSLFLAGQLQIFCTYTSLLKALLTFAPLLGAIMIAISRCQDYRHDVYDVTCGAIVGTSIAYFSYRRYFPSLRSSRCDEPFKVRVSSSNDGLGKMKNDEEMVRQGREFVGSDDEDI